MTEEKNGKLKDNVCEGGGGSMKEWIDDGRRGENVSGVRGMNKNYR